METAQFPNPADSGRSCYLCGGRDFEFLHGWEVGDSWNPASIPLAVWSCRCGLVLLHPVPAEQQLPDHGDWWSKNRKPKRRNRRFKKFREKLVRRLFLPPYQRFVKQTRKAVRSGRLLDVGCGKGFLLEYASHWFEPVGLEPSAEAAEIARGRGFEVIESTLEEVELDPHGFDVVMMDSVIEHMHSPVSALKRINRLLRPGGVVALKTPKFGGPAYHRHGGHWNGFRQGYHTYLFTGKTLGWTLNAAGFETLAKPRRDRFLDDILILWGRKVHEAYLSTGQRKQFRVA